MALILDSLLAKLEPLLGMSHHELAVVAQSRSLSKKGSAAQLRLLLVKDIVHECKSVPLTDRCSLETVQLACAKLFEQVLEAGRLAPGRADDALCEAAALEYESDQHLRQLGEAGEAVAPEDLENVIPNLRRCEVLKAESLQQRALAAFAKEVGSARDYLGLAPLACQSCGDAKVKSVTCRLCAAVSCAACVADGVMALEDHDSPDNAHVCFRCGGSLERDDVALVLVREHPKALERLMSHAARAEAFKLHVDYINATKRKHRFSLGEQVVDIVTSPLTCANCDTPVVLGLECMHMSCGRCSFQMCGFCLGPHSECSSETCRLNPKSGEENYSANKQKTMMVLRAYRVAQALKGRPVGEREVALRDARASLEQAAMLGVGSYAIDDPWLFRESIANGEDVYLTPILRTVLHCEYGGVSGTDAPAVPFLTVRCGDVVRLVDLVVDGVPELCNLLVDVDSDGADFEEVARRHVGRRGVVVSFESHSISILMLHGDLLVAQWDAIVSLQPLCDALAGAPREQGTVRAGDFVKVSLLAKQMCEGRPKGWHPMQAEFAGKWVRVVETHADGYFSTRLRYDDFHFPVETIEELVRARSVV